MPQEQPSMNALTRSSGTIPFSAPDFASYSVTDYLPAFEASMAAHMAEVTAIAENPASPTMANTIDALELSGQEFDRVSAIFWNLSGTDSDDAMRKIEREMSPRMAAHAVAITTNGKLFQRIDTLFKTREKLALAGEQLQVLTKLHQQFVKGGAGLTDDQKPSFKAIRQRLAELGTAFSQNVLKDETDWVMQLTKDDLAGLPAFLISAAEAEAVGRGLSGYAITLSRSSVEPFLVFSMRRDLREKAFRAWAARGDAGETDNKPIIAETLKLRAEMASILGYSDYAAYKFSDTMAKTPAAARKLLNEVWTAGKAKAMAERDELASLAKADSLASIEPWDWRHYAEKLRLAKHALDEAVLKPYFQLEKMIAAAFDCATKLFGLTFELRHDIPLYHPDVRVWEVKARDGSHVALFYGDYFARPGKRSGAWMSSFRDQKKLGGEQHPLIINVMNFVKPAEGQPALLSFDDARTLFHEFGHALHGLMSNVTYPSLAGTNVPRDFVELPSQLYEHWLDEADVLGRFAVHAETGAALPKDLLAKLLSTRTYGQGFMTVEYCASALVDLAYHTTSPTEIDDIGAFEAKTLAAIGMPREIIMRHRSPHFQHIFSGDGYSAGYYSYLWSEVLDADAFQAFKDSGDIFHAETAKRLATHIYGAGHSRDPDAAYIAFRGKLPDVGPLLAKRGLKDAA
jgi:peptidyl-dipeptidase Dcp